MFIKKRTQKYNTTCDAGTHSVVKSYIILCAHCMVHTHTYPVMSILYHSIFTSKSIKIAHTHTVLIFLDLYMWQLCITFNTHVYTEGRENSTCQIWQHCVYTWQHCQLLIRLLYATVSFSNLPAPYSL